MSFIIPRRSHEAAIQDICTILQDAARYPENEHMLRELDKILIRHLQSFFDLPFADKQLLLSIILHYASEIPLLLKPINSCLAFILSRLALHDRATYL